MLHPVPVKDQYRSKSTVEPSETKDGELKLHGKTYKVKINKDRSRTAWTISEGKLKGLRIQVNWGKRDIAPIKAPEVYKQKIGKEEVECVKLTFDDYYMVYTKHPVVKSFKQDEYSPSYGVIEDRSYRKRETILAVETDAKPELDWSTAKLPKAENKKPEAADQKKSD